VAGVGGYLLPRLVPDPRSGPRRPKAIDPARHRLPAAELRIVLSDEQRSAPNDAGMESWFPALTPGDVQPGGPIKTRAKAGSRSSDPPGLQRPPIPPGPGLPRTPAGRATLSAGPSAEPDCHVSVDHGQRERGTVRSSGGRRVTPAFSRRPGRPQAGGANGHRLAPT
jgi:hypothetical protein